MMKKTVRKKGKKETKQINYEKNSKKSIKNKHNVMKNK